MSLLEILKVVGFATGATLHLYIAWLIYLKQTEDKGRKPGFPYGSNASALSSDSKDFSTERSGLIGSERTFIALGLCLGLWFGGNLLITLQEVALGPGRATAFLRAWNTIAVVGIALFPSLLLHSHLAFWSWMDRYRTLSARRTRLYSYLFYIPMIVLPYTVLRVNTGDYKLYLSKLHVLLIPYSIWFVAGTWSSAALDWVMAGRLNQWAGREKSFLRGLALMLVANGAFEMLVVGIYGPNPGNVLWVTYILLSLLPTFTIAYHIYRYNFYELIIKGSLVYATLAVLFLTIYTYGIRHLDSFLVRRFDVRAGVVEAILILAMFALGGPLVRIIDRILGSLFTREIEIYRDVVKRVSGPTPQVQRRSASSNAWNAWNARNARLAAVGGVIEQPETGWKQGSDVPGSSASPGPKLSPSSDLAGIIHFTEETIRRGLELGTVTIMPVESLPRDTHEWRVSEKLTVEKLNAVESDDDLAALGCDIAYALRHNETLIAIMAISSGARALTPEKRAVLDVLSGQVALHIESCLLLEQKFQLERKLAARERLASLGQMAATIAHEVKNPLSSIKSIAQVMREDDRLSDYRLDLDLIVGEMDRLSSTVSRLLSFSKPDAIGNASAPHVSLSKLVAGTVALFTHDADDRHQIIEVKPGSDVALPGWMATPLQEVIGNLLLNAIQASPDEGRVTVDYIIESESRDTAEPGGNNDQSGAGLQASERVVTLSVIDEGPGVSAELQDSIFDPFFTTKPRGTGLGLSIVRRRLNELGGSISVESPMAHGKGASFVVTLHLAGIHSEHTAVCDPS